MIRNCSATPPFFTAQVFQNLASTCGYFCKHVLSMAPVGLFFPALMLVGQTGSAGSIQSILDRVRNHSFHPMNKEQSFTHDRHLQKDGIADLDDTDWKVRLLAKRDLVVAGEEAVPEMIEALDDENMHVRQIAAAALGIRRAKAAIEPLEALAENDPTSLVRSQAVVSLGQMESKGSIPLLKKLQEASSRDIKHQAQLAVDQIQKGKGATDALRQAYHELDESQFEIVKQGEQALDFTLPDTEGQPWRLSQHKGQWTVLIWVFADWCPVCHGEFRDLMKLESEFKQENIEVVTIEIHDTYRGRVMVGKELAPEYWFSDKPFQEVYTERIWWRHLLDRAGKIGAAYGADPRAFAVHSEYINRPSTIIIDPQGTVRLAYYGTYWGDRPTIHETIEMIRNEDFDFKHPNRLSAE